MKEVFADAGYWIAVFMPRDHLHGKAMQVSKTLGSCRLVTSEMVLVELLNALSNCGTELRTTAADAVERLRRDANVSIVPQSSSQFSAALKFYQRRADKNWSLTDCASFLIMEERAIQEALAHDRGFQQAGFTALLRDD